MSSRYAYPDDFRKRFVDVYGAPAADLLARLPERVVEWEARLGLTELRLVAGLSYNLVFYGETRAGMPIVLKAAPAPEALASEAAALQGFGPERAAAVLEVLPNEGLLLTERLEPGARLAQVATEREALLVVARLFAAGWPASIPQPLDNLDVFTRSSARVGEQPGPLDAGLMREAHDVRATLLASAGPARLLHGDLHYDNILVDGRAGHRLIDPKGLHGDPLFDLGYLVSRTMPLGVDELPIDRAVSLRLDVLAAAFGCERQRLAAWAFVAAALSAVWTLEDHGEVYADEITVLRQLAGCLRA